MFIQASARWVLAMLAVIASQAASGAEACDDLAAIAVTPRVDYHAQVQEVWFIRCSNCHANFGGSPAAGLSLNPEDSWLELVDIPSPQVPGRVRVLPGRADASYLFEKINCDLPEVGDRMPRGRLPIPLDEQALIRDWINQGAHEFVVPVLFEDGFEAR